MTRYFIRYDGNKIISLIESTDKTLKLTNVIEVTYEQYFDIRMNFDKYTIENNKLVKSVA